MDGSRSDNLRWKLAEITGNGWQRKLFFLTAPPPLPGHSVRRLLGALRHSAKEIQIPQWNMLTRAKASMEP
jgi:hypothetical protein